MLMELKGKIAIVTGASSGIGLATAELLAKRGAQVALVSRSKQKLDSLSKSLPGSFVVVADMTNESDIKRMVKSVENHYGRIDILVNNAGRGYDASIEKTDMNEFRRLFDLDVAGPLLAMQHVIPIMRKHGGGAIINISSGTALMCLPGMAAYSSLKRALTGISLTAREELAQDNISVGVVYPYITLTDFEKNTLKGKGAGEGQLGGDETGAGTGESADAPNPGGRSRPPSDTAEFVAQNIIEGIKSGEAEIFVHDWMKNLGKN